MEDEQQLFPHKMNKYTKIYVLIDYHQDLEKILKLKI